MSAFLLGHKRALSMVSPWVQQREVVTSELVYAEVFEFISDFPDFRARHAQLLSVVQSAIPLLGLNRPILERYSDIRRFLRPKNQLIGDVDTLIASTALEFNLTVVTNNVRHFQRAPSLSVIAY